MGARLFALGPESKSVGCIVMAGHDFPEVVLQQIRSWDLDLVVHEVLDKTSTRGLLKYGDLDFGRSADVLHSLAKPDDIEKQTHAVLEARASLSLHRKPYIIWEPLPPFCISENGDAHLRACRFVDIFSPNHIELGKLVHPGSDLAASFDRSVVEMYAQRIVDHGIGQEGRGTAVIRCGEHGCLVSSSSYGPRWFPTYYDPSSPKVVDTTGAGNAFLGGFAIALAKTDDLTEATIHGMVSASFALEQIGLPVQGGSGGHETWNDVEVSQRLEEYRKRLQDLPTE
ncbi:hypothetical protein SLS62_000455 [Diatrype stigma]|uniref:Carbohydrate kinase PfkB domain-containing protein n=1 Tax=Diatrype stigma TaxID=117547 RepID=A0AAN9UXM6_9PEZI